MVIVASLLGGSSGLSYSVLRSQPRLCSSIRESSQARAMQSASTCRTGMPFMDAFVLSVVLPARASKPSDTGRCVRVARLRRFGNTNDYLRRIGLTVGQAPRYKVGNG